MGEDEDSEENIYDEEGREDQVDDDTITPEEEGFMQGYEKASEEKKEEKEVEEETEKEE